MIWQRMKRSSSVLQTRAHIIFTLHPHPTPPHPFLLVRIFCFSILLSSYLISLYRLSLLCTYLVPIKIGAQRTKVFRASTSLISLPFRWSRGDFFYLRDLGSTKISWYLWWAFPTADSKLWLEAFNRRGWRLRFPSFCTSSTPRLSVRKLLRLQTLLQYYTTYFVLILSSRYNSSILENSKNKYSSVLGNLTAGRKQLSKLSCLWSKGLYNI